MPITRRADYAIRLMYELAQLPHGVTISRKDLCAGAAVPEAFGEHLVSFLIDAGLIKQSGYSSNIVSLAVPAETVSMARVVCASDPQFSLSECTRDPAHCDRSTHCGVHAMWIELDQLVWDYLRATTLAHVATRRPVPHEALASPFASGCATLNDYS